MKIHHLVFIPIICGLVGCKGGEKKSAKEKDIPVKITSVELRSKGIEDLTGSVSLREIICQVWDYKEDLEQAEDMDPYATMQVQYRGYCFFNDGKFVKDPRAVVKTGTWMLEENPRPAHIMFTYADGSEQTEIPAFFSPDKMIFAGNKAGKRQAIFTANGYRHMNLKDDPFHPNNIWWMIKPASAETNDQIKKRFKACIHFFVLFYEEYVNVRAKKVSFLGLPSPYRWYAGGIILQKEKKLSEKWMNCFYNKEQALKAYQLADELVTKKYIWPKDEGQWMKRNLGVLKQMENKLDSIN